MSNEVSARVRRICEKQEGAERTYETDLVTFPCVPMAGWHIGLRSMLRTIYEASKYMSDWYLRDKYECGEYRITRIGTDTYGEHAGGLWIDLEEVA